MTTNGPRLPTVVSPVEGDSWSNLRRYTDARIALGRSGSGLPTTAHLAFQAAHARARDAVHTPLDVDALVDGLTARGWESATVTSAVADRPTYLMRPDLGRRLSAQSQDRLSVAMPTADVVIVVADGLSSTAVHANALPALDALVPLLGQNGCRLAPVVVATQARVALGDHIGEILQAKVAAVLIGERPGLSAVDSLGIYLTWMPRRGRLDAERNCISNVRNAGLAPMAAARQAAALITDMFRHQAAGVALNARRALPGSSTDSCFGESPSETRPDRGSARQSESSGE
jgi:ethanolamine ammonia-lyase small subunit